MKRAPAALALALTAACTAPSPGPATPTPDRPAEAVAALVPAAASAPRGERAASDPADRKKKRKKLRFIHTKAERTIRPSLYQGKWFRQKDEIKRRCLVWRESNGRYRVVNPSSGSAGAYQFMLATSNYVARDLIGRPGLVGVPASAWPRRTQDRAFWRLWNDGKGRHHWRGGNYSCGF